MQITLLRDAGPVVLAHIAMALGAIGIGAAVFIRRKGTRVHRWMGRLYVVLLAGVALTSFAIHGLRQIGPFSWLHLLSIVTLATLVLAVSFARKGRIEAHRRTMTYLYWSGLVLAGLFTLVPGRLLHTVMFGP